MKDICRLGLANDVFRRKIIIRHFKWLNMHNIDLTSLTNKNGDFCQY